MALSSEKLSALAGHVIGLLPTSMTFNGENYTVAKTVLKKERAYEMAGYVDNYTFSVSARIADFAVPPSVEDIVLLDSKRYRVIGTERDAANALLRIDLADEFAG